ncbi:MAG TPA: cupredoxin domain-containing protein [Patescibacteria group bacterium]|jgi:nitrite reductase (NO-forming)|nr:cupredoxin domain-containing protein [Patescibacteria group bacterium]
MDDEQKQYGYGKRPLWQWILLYIVIGVVIYGLVYYFVLAKNGKGYNNTAVTPTYTSPTTIQTSPSQAPSSAVTIQKITVTGTEYAFTPSTFTLKKGQPAEITFKNAGAFPHNLTISALNLKTKTIQPGEEDSIRFTPDKTGQFSFTCTVPGHADKGMKGTLSVQ